MSPSKIKRGSQLKFNILTFILLQWSICLIVFAQNEEASNKTLSNNTNFDDNGPGKF